ncbi:MAG: glutamate synthase large subunit, partial [Verrucomicrobiota bacterium]
MQHPYYSTPVPNEGTLHSFDREHDNCGVGLVAHIEGVRSHRVLAYGLESVARVTHRGALDADGKTGDGAGVGTQIPYKLFLPIAEELGTPIANPEKLAIGMFFMPVEEAARLSVMKIVTELCASRDFKVIGWRDVPVDESELGDKARSTCPVIEQLLLEVPAHIDGDTAERQLFLIRRAIEKRAASANVEGLYIASLSARLLSYKGLMTAAAVPKFFLDLQNPDYETAICLFHQRFSTNTFPSWPLGHPFRMLCHNGEINTLRGNRNWFNSRISRLNHPFWEGEKELLEDLIDPDASDSASLDAAFELLVLSGRSIEHAMSILIPPAWRIDPLTTDEEKAFYQFHRCFSEPWDGPAAVAFTDGKKVAACLDRNGLRPLRYKITTDGIFTAGSEVGLVDLPDDTVIKKGRLGPGQMICIDTEKGEVIRNRDIRKRLASEHPYGDWLAEHLIQFNDRIDPAPTPRSEPLDILTLSQQQVAHAYNEEEIKLSLTSMLKGGIEATYSMGDDIPLSVLSLQPRLLYTYFKQLFAQVTNPPIDPIRERLVMSLVADLGTERNLLKTTPEHAKVIRLDSPFLFEHQLEALRTLSDEFPVHTLDTTWPVADGANSLESAIDVICKQAEKAANEGIRVLVLSDRAMCEERVAMPALLAVGAVHQHLIRSGDRMKLSLVVDTGEARDTHQMACLIGFGATAICPYLAFDTVREILESDKAEKRPQLGDLDEVTALSNYKKALEKGVLKIMSKMGISILNSYQGAQIFEAIGIGKRLIQKCFAGTPSQLDGITFAEIARESIIRHQGAYAQPLPDSGRLALGDPGYYRWRRDGERHSVTGDVIKNFHSFIKSGKKEEYEQYVADIKETKPVALHDLFEFKPLGKAIPVDEVEPIEDIRVRFTTAAMSMGALSPEAHETLAIAMNRIGGKSDSGEGGEDVRRFKPYPNGDSANSKIKQVASGRFGVSAEYLANAQEIEIKMAQGAKPGEGGQLPAHKVTGLVARLRNTQPGVQLISPPPHHDIYSIEDLAQLIHDLKEVNPRARVCVKLVAETGVGTIAAGVAKANADVILVSGHEGGTGASPLSSIKHAGLPWEIGVAETQQVLMLNNLRDRVTLRTDGGLRTGRDIISAAILGAEEFNFGTIAMIAMGCVYVRRCHLNNCPVGVATTDPKFRAKFKGEVEHVVNFFNAVAEETREIMASLGARKLTDIIGRPSLIGIREVPDHPKANMLDFSLLLKDVNKGSEKAMPRHRTWERNDGLHEAPLDDQIIQDAREAIANKTPIQLSYKVKNTNRNVGTKLSGQVAYTHGNHGLPNGTIDLQLQGSAGQSFATLLCGGIKITLTGEANDYVGKGMCGGEIIVRPPENRAFVAAENSIIGNTVLYGATGGHLFANGRAGERLCVRNSGATAVVEGCGDHGCEYMTNGVVLILGHVGSNFGAGMSGGVAFVLDESGDFEKLYNREMIHPEPLEDPEDQNFVKALIYQHLEHTESEKAQAILADWDTYAKKFLAVRPYKPDT